MPPATAQLRFRIAGFRHRQAAAGACRTLWQRPPPNCGAGQPPSPSPDSASRLRASPAASPTKAPKARLPTQE